VYQVTQHEKTRLIYEMDLNHRHGDEHKRKVYRLKSAIVYNNCHYVTIIFKNDESILIVDDDKINRLDILNDSISEKIVGLFYELCVSTSV